MVGRRSRPTIPNQPSLTGGAQQAVGCTRGTCAIRSQPTWAYNPRVAEYFCYMIECADGTFYTGWTTDPERRLKQHRAGYGARYTRTRRPLRLAYLEPQPDISTAMRREKAIKALSRKKKLALIAGRSEEWSPSP
jgi:putative endonuclease